jgi:hypothetical protein
MPNERSQTLARGGRPNFYCAVIRAWNDKVILYGNN